MKSVDITENNVDAALADMREKVDEIERKAKTDSELRQNLHSYQLDSRMVEYLANPLREMDPLSTDYVEAMKALHDRLSGRKYQFSNEGIPGLDIEWETRFGFPWGTRDGLVIGDNLIAFGTIFMKAGLRAGASILEVGSGFGSLTELLARAGYRVDALDVNPEQCEIVRRKTAHIPMRPKIICVDLNSFLTSNAKRYDAILFFASFHHFMDHAAVLKRLAHDYLAEGGKIIMGHEPLACDNLPLPWWFSLDASGLRAILKWGWVELLFSREYITRLLEFCGLSAETLDLGFLVASCGQSKTALPVRPEFAASISCTPPRREEGFLVFDELRLRNEGYGSWITGPERVNLGWKVKDVQNHVMREGRVMLSDLEISRGETCSLYRQKIPLTELPESGWTTITLQMVWEYWQWFGEEKILTI